MRIVVACLLAVISSSIHAEAQTDKQRTLFALGWALGKSVATFNLTEPELEMVQAGLSAGVLSKRPDFELKDYSARIGQLERTRMALTADKQKKLGRAYADKVAALPGAQKTASGLVYWPIEPGTGATPKKTDLVKAYSSIALSDGAVFDSSYRRDAPRTYPLEHMVPCWQEGLGLMKVGGRAKLVCPPDLAYGDRGFPPQIPPGSTVVFDIELVGIVSKETAKDDRQNR